MGLFNFFQKKEAIETFESIKERALKGDTEAQFQIAKELDQQEEYSESVKWLEMAEQNNHCDARYFLALDYKGGCGVPKNLDKAIKLSEDLLNINNDLRGAKLLGDIYAEKQVSPAHPLAKYYDVQKAEYYYLMIMRSENPNCWLEVSDSLGRLYGNAYRYEGEFFSHELSNPMKAVYCWYLCYLYGYEDAMEEIKMICDNAKIAITSEQMEKWKDDFRNVRCSI